MLLNLFAAVTALFGFLAKFKVIGTVVGDFLKPTVGSVNGAVFFDDLGKALKAALAAGSLSGGLVAALTFLAGESPAIFTSSIIAFLVAHALALISTLVVRMGQGPKGVILSATEAGQVFAAPVPPVPAVEPVAEPEDPNTVGQPAA